MKTGSKRDVRIVFENGLTVVMTPSTEITYKYRKWIFKINPRLIFPGLRKEHRKIILDAGKRIGYAEFRGGCVPLPEYCYKKSGIFNTLLYFIRVKLGLFCKEENKGYFIIKFKDKQFLIVKRFTPEECLFCQVYELTSMNLISNFVFSPDFEKVVLYVSISRWSYYMYAIIGYVVDVMIYALASKSLNREIEIKFK